MADELTKDLFLHGWNQDKGYSLQPFIESGKQYMYGLARGKNLNTLLSEPIDSFITWAVCNAISHTYETIGNYNKDKGAFKDFFLYACKKMFYLKLKEECPQGVQIDLNQLRFDEEDSLPDITDAGAHMSIAQKESDQYKSDTIKKIYDTLNTLNPEERRIFDIEFLHDLSEEDIQRIDSLLQLKHRRKATALFVSEELGVTEEVVRQKLSRLIKKIQREVDLKYYLNPTTYKQGASLTSFTIKEPELFTQADFDSLSFEDCMEFVFQQYLRHRNQKK